MDMIEMGNAWYGLIEWLNDCSVFRPQNKLLLKSPQLPSPLLPPPKTKQKPTAKNDWSFLCLTRTLCFWCSCTKFCSLVWFEKEGKNQLVVAVDVVVSWDLVQSTWGFEVPKENGLISLHVIVHAWKAERRWKDDDNNQLVSCAWLLVWEYLHYVNGVKTIYIA